MDTIYVKFRKSNYAKINNLKGQLIGICNSGFLEMNEKTQIQIVINEIDRLREIYYNNRGIKIENKNL